MGELGAVAGDLEHSKDRWSVGGVHSAVLVVCFSVEGNTNLALTTVSSHVFWGPDDIFTSDHHLNKQLQTLQPPN